MRKRNAQGKFQPESIEHVFHSRYRHAESGCWLWSGPLQRTGYARVWFRGRLIMAHRLSWELINGPIPVGQFVLHRCDVRHCVNPAHLFLGSSRDNTQDMLRKDRGGCVLNTKRVLEILERRKNGESIAGIARSFGVHYHTVSRVIHGQQWKHLTARKEAA